MENEQAAEVAGGDAGRNNLAREEIENVSTSQSRKESDGQETETENVRSQCCDSTLASASHSESASTLLRRPPPPPMTVEEATRSDPGAATHEARNRKRARSSTQPTVLPDDNVPRKRPRRATKETWKAKDAREVGEEFEAKRSRTWSDRYWKKQTFSISPNYSRGKAVTEWQASRIPI